MEATFKQIEWHLEILPRPARKALDFLSNQTWLKRSAWYLAGGTALALQAGHRSSADLDFFTPKNNFSNGALLRHFLEDPNWKTSITVSHNYHHILKSLVYFSDAENDPMPSSKNSFKKKSRKLQILLSN